MEYLIIAAQLILSLSILVVLHEWGHFFPARLFGTRVEKFYLFFNPWFSLFKKKIGETEYGIGWLPLGGYVKIAGMMDESFDKDQLAQEPQPWEFRSKPAWQRLIIMIGGVTVNFILGFLLWGMVLFIWGEKSLPAENVKYGIYCDDLAQEMGLKNGDKIISIGGKPFENFGDLRRDIVFDEANTMTVQRGSQQVKLDIDEKYVSALAGYRGFFVMPRFPFVAGEIMEDSPAEAGGIEVGDSIIAFNDMPVKYFDEFKNIASTSRNETVKVTLIRNDSTWEQKVKLDTCGRMGVVPYGEDRYLTYGTQEYTLAEALPAGVSKGWDFLAANVKGFAMMFTGKIKASESLGGFGTIANLFPPKWDWSRFWKITAILSLILAFMNILPIPLLDGGHVMFLLYEMVVGRPPSDKFMEISMNIGLFFIMGLLLYANGMDAWRAWVGSGATAC